MLVLVDFLEFLLEIEGLKVAVGQDDFVEFLFVESPHFFELVFEMLFKLLVNFLAPEIFLLHFE